MLNDDHIRWLKRIQNGMVETAVSNDFIDKLKKERLIIDGSDRFFLSAKGKKVLK